MAKKGKKGFRIPKEIGGIKVPKETRRAAEAVIEKVRGPEGRKMVASGLAMAATAAAAMAAKQAQAKKAEPEPAKPGQSGTVDSQQVADAIGQAATAFMSKFFQPW